MYVGVDGFRGGWIAIAIADTGFVEGRPFARFDELMSCYADARVVGVDMPIGLAESGGRDADREARRHLPGQASSVFSAPVRAVLGARDYREARRLSLQACGKSLSKQAFNLVAKIAEVDAFQDDARVHEVHPELSFRQLSSGERLLGKKTWGGLHRRLDLLGGAGIELPGTLGSAGEVGIDDVVDAAVVAWSARRIDRGEASSFPKEPTQRDRSGRLIAIWA